MTDALRPSRAGALAVAGGCAALSAVLVLVATRHGPGVSPDSVQYVASARNLFEGRGFNAASGNTLTTFPPGLPAVLAIGLHLGVEPSTTARALNAGSMAAIVLLAFVLLRRHVRSTWAVLTGTALVALSPTLLRTADMIWSEPLFSALLLGFVVVAEDLMRGPERGGVRLVSCAVIVWAAFLTRWMGIALIPAGMASLLVAPSRDGRLRRVVGFAALASVVPALWLVRNVTTGDSLAGTRSGGVHTLSEFARTALLGIGRTVVPGSLPNALTELAAVALVMAFAGGAVLASRARTVADDSGSPAWPMTPLVATVGFSLPVVFGSYLFAGIELNARILAPVYAPLVVIGFAWFERARVDARAAGREWLSNVVSGAFLVWFALMIVWAAGLVRDHGREARGYAAPVWAHSELVRAAGQLEPSAVLYTNVPLPVVTITDRYPVLDVRDLHKGCAGRAVLAIYGTDTSALDASRTAGVEITELRHVDDGTLYRVACRA
jgi:hypothetical protein